MAKLAVNVDHVATLRQARRTEEPDPVTAAALTELAGAQGIVIHLREDRRHIQERDLNVLRQTVKTKLNLEMAATQETLKIALSVKPDMVTLVPERREERITEGGLEVQLSRENLKKYIRLFKAFLASGRGPEQPIAGWSMVPLPVQRRLARRGHQEHSR